MKPVVVDEANAVETAGIAGKKVEASNFCPTSASRLAEPTRYMPE